MNHPEHNPPTTLDAGKCSAALGDPDTSALTLLTIAMWAFGDNVLGDPEANLEPMDPSGLWAGLNEMFGTWVTEEGENKLNALMLALQSDLFYRDVDVFSSVCEALMDGDLGDMVQGNFGELSSVEIMWAVLEVELAHDNEQGPPEFSQGIVDIISRALTIEQESQDENVATVKSYYEDLLHQLRDIGVPISALRLFDAEFAETLEVMESADAIQAQVVA